MIGANSDLNLWEITCRNFTLPNKDPITGTYGEYDKKVLDNSKALYAYCALSKDEYNRILHLKITSLVERIIDYSQREKSD